jgi:hypothetical protein
MVRYSKYFCIKPQKFLFLYAPVALAYTNLALGFFFCKTNCPSWPVLVLFVKRGGLKAMLTRLKISRGCGIFF